MHDEDLSAHPASRFANWIQKAADEMWEYSSKDRFDIVIQVSLRDQLCIYFRKITTVTCIIPLRQAGQVPRRCGAARTRAGLAPA